MTLEARLAELVSARGLGLLADPEEFRAALDDYLTDEELEPGDRNVLVDAVRLGAVRRLVVLLEQGSDQSSAVSESGLALARERGSDDARRSLHATALLGFAAGRIDEQVLRSFGTAPSPPVPAPPPAPAAPPPPDPVSTPTEVLGASPWATPPPVAGRRRRTPVLVAAAAGVVLVVGGALLWWVLTRGESPEDAVEDWFAARSCKAVADRMTGTALEQLQPELDLGQDSSFCATFPDYKSDYEVKSVDERDDRATVEVEGTQHYDGNDDSIADTRDFSVVIDLEQVDGKWLVSNFTWKYADE